jgi:hypothetical protein
MEKEEKQHVANENEIPCKMNDSLLFVGVINKIYTFSFSFF